MVRLALGGNSSPRATVQSVVGANGYAINTPASYSAVAFGYPLNFLNGQVMAACSGTTAIWSQDESMLRLGCPWAEGASGGPWLAQFDNQNGYGKVRSVTSLVGPKQAGYHNIEGPRFGNEFSKMVTMMNNH
jgi:hypothetical protein